MLSGPSISYFAGPVTFIGNAYAGRSPLWKAFWLFFVPTPFLLTGIYISAFWTFPEISLSVTYVMRFVLVFSLASFLIASVPASAVWRCAQNTNRRLWGNLAKITVAVYLVWLGWKTVATWFLFFSTVDAVKF